MNSKRTIITLAQFLVLAGLVLGVYELTKTAPLPTPGPETKSEVSVRYGEISRGTVRRYITVFGVVVPEPATANKPSAIAHVVLPWGTSVTEINCFEGQSVKKGQLLFSLNNLTEIKSPMTGTVVSIQMSPGDTGNSQARFIDVVDLDRLVIDSNLPAEQLQNISIGQAVEIIPHSEITAATMPATAPSPLTGTISVIDLQIDPKTNMGSIDIALPPAAGMRLGQFVSAKIILEEHQNVLIAPAEAIVKDVDGKAHINLVKADVALPKPVQIGIRDGDIVEISGQGIAAGQTIVTTNASWIIESVKVRDLGEDKD